VDGSEDLAGWQPCASADQCGGKPNWKNICSAWAPAEVNPFLANLYQDEHMLWIAQDPNESDPFYMDRFAEYREISPGAATPTTLVDAAYFTQSDARAWDGAYVAIWAKPNIVYYLKVTGFDPARHELAYEKLPNEHYTDPRGRYALLNHSRVLDTPGEYVFSQEKDDRGRQKVYLWPLGGEMPPKGVTVTLRSVGFDLNGRQHVVVQGFTIQKFSSRPPNRGAAVSNDRATGAQDILVRDNVIRWCNTDLTTWKHAGINLTGVKGGAVENNRVYENRRAGGI